MLRPIKKKSKYEIKLNEYGTNFIFIINTFI